MNYFSIQTVRAKEIAEQQKNMAIEMSSVSEKVYSLLNHSKINTVLNYSQRTTLRNAQEAVAAQQLQMARLSAALYESAVEYENADKGSMQTPSPSEETITQADLKTIIEQVSLSGAINNFTSDEKIISNFKGFKDTIIGPFDCVKTWMEWVRQSKVDWPDGVDGFMDFIDILDDGIKLYSATKKYVVGDVTNNPELQAEGATGYLDVLKGMLSGTEQLKELKKGYGFSPYNPFVLMTDYGFNMYGNWMKAISKEDATIQDVYFQTLATSALETALDTVYDKKVLALTYYPTKWVTGLFGYDLEGSYEKVSDKKGLAAVFEATGELKDILVENATWENWKSGMKILFGWK